MIFLLTKQLSDWLKFSRRETQVPGISKYVCKRMDKKVMNDTIWKRCSSYTDYSQTAQCNYQ